MKTIIYDTQYVVFADFDIPNPFVFHAYSRSEAMKYAHLLVDELKVDKSHVIISKRSFYKLS